MAKYRILIVYDVPGWAYHRRALALQRHAPPEFEVVVCSARMIPRQSLRDGAFHLVFELDYFQVGTWQRLREHLPPNVHFPLIVSFNKDHNSKHIEFEQTVAGADVVIINNRLRYDHCSYTNVVNISNGVETDVFKPLAFVTDRPKQVLYAGSTSTKKGKNYHPILVPLAMELDQLRIGHNYLPVDHVPSPTLLSEKQMVWWYNTGQVILCASSSEGTPNIILEGMACGCVPVTTPVGNAPELIRDDENGIICKPTVRDFRNGVAYAIDNAERLSLAAMKTIHEGGWSWSERSRYFFALFRKAIEDGAESVPRVSYMDGKPEDLFA